MMSRIPWIGLAALIGMFVLPYVPNWLFEGPRTVKHRPRRHVCADCNAPWTPEHTCPPAVEIRRSLRGELRRLDPPAGLDPAGVLLPPRRAGREIMRRVPGPALGAPAGSRSRRARRPFRRSGPPL
jgi:hypothetical protein